MKSITRRDVPNDLWELLTKARSVAELAYNRYSKYYVGAAILTHSGDIYLGTFFENSSGPVGVCAERVAIGAAVTHGERDYQAIALAGGPQLNYCGPPVVPCGLCRQALSEFIALSSHQDIVVLCSDMALENVAITSVKELLPHAFTRE